MSDLMKIAVGIAIPLLGTTLGACMVFFMKVDDGAGRGDGVKTWIYS